MNRTIISIEVQAHNGKEATIIVKGEQNNQIMFEKQFEYKDEEKHSLRLHLLSERFHRKLPQLGDSLGVFCIRKLFNDITIRSKVHETSYRLCYAVSSPKPEKVLHEKRKRNAADPYQQASYPKYNCCH